METIAIVLQQPEQLVLSTLPLTPPTDEDVVVAIDWSGISTGTERLLWSGRMPAFPGMGYPLVPGYESVGRVIQAGARAGRQVGDTVFVPGAKCFGDVRGLFGGAAARVVLPGARTLPVSDRLGLDAVLLALAATAYHALADGGPLPADPRHLPDLIVGHGVLGRMLARLVVLAGGAPTVWERDAARQDGACGYTVLDPQADARRDYRTIVDVSGDSRLLDTLVARLAPRGTIVLAGFYEQALAFDFAPAFMREARLRIAAQWQPADLAAVGALMESGALALDGLITHHEPAAHAAAAYRTAFTDPRCLKMVIDWRNAA